MKIFSRVSSLCGLIAAAALLFPAPGSAMVSHDATSPGTVELDQSAYTATKIRVT